MFSGVFNSIAELGMGTGTVNRLVIPIFFSMVLLACNPAASEDENPTAPQSGTDYSALSCEELLAGAQTYIERNRNAQSSDRAICLTADCNLQLRNDAAFQAITRELLRKNCVEM